MAGTLHRKPTERQLRYLRQLAVERGETFSAPKTAKEASEEIDRLKKRRPSSRIEVRVDRDEVSRALGAARGADVRDDEVSGYGSSAAWRQRS